LDSFGTSITMHSSDDDKTHLSPDIVKSSIPKQLSQTTAPYSTMTLAELSKHPQVYAYYNDYLKHGYCFIENLFSESDLKQFQIDSKEILKNSNFGENSFYGFKTRRSYSILAKSRALDNYLCHPTLTLLVQSFLAPNALLSALQLIDILPGEVTQKLHYDQQFMNIGTQTRGIDHSLNLLVAIDDFTADNGATVIIPESHLWPPERIPGPKDNLLPCIMKAGTICLFSGSIWHAGGANRTNQSRRALITVFTQPWFRTLENHFLAIPFTVAAKLPEQIQNYLGYSLHHPYTGLVDFQHPKKKIV